MRSGVPGVLDVIASLLLRVSMLMRLLFPTLDRPMKAYSGLLSWGHLAACVLLMMNRALVIYIVFFKIGDS